MIVFGIREGAATNSSSTHSVLLKRKDIVNIEDAQIRDSSLNYFYCCASEGSKIELALRHLYGQTNKGDYGNKNVDTDEFLRIKRIIDRNGMFPDNVYEQWDYSPDCKVQFYFPYKYNSNKINDEFVRDFIEDWLHADVFIVGGHDSFTEEIYIYKQLAGQESHLTELTRHLRGENTAVQIGPKAWVLMSRLNSRKIRVQFSNLNFPQKTWSPELVDLNITNFCSRDCEYCYRDCSASGTYATVDTCDMVFDTLSQHQVLEVAIGGGEPLSHPDFWTIVNRAKHRGLHVNVSTRDYSIFDTKASRDRVAELLYGVGISVDDVNDIKNLDNKLLTFLEEQQSRYRSEGYHDVNIVFHIAMGTITRDKFTEIMNYASEYSIRLLLLGFKEAGRGRKFNKIDYWWLADELDKFFCYDVKHNIENYIGPNISFDTVLVGEMADWLKKRKVDPRMWQAREGVNSCYIDAVSMTMAPSSFSDEVVPFSPETFKQYWSNFSG